MKSLTPTEHEEQCTFVEWLETQSHKFTAIPNGGVRHIGQAVKLKKEGVRPGLPDILVIVDDHLVWIEMKRSGLKPKRKGMGGVFFEQQSWIDALNRCDNCQAYVAYSALEAIEIVKSIQRH